MNTEPAHNEAGHDHKHGGIFGERSELMFALLSGAFLIVGFAAEKLVDGIAEWVPFACYLAAYSFGGFYTVREAFENIRKRKFEIDTLMLVAATGAAFLGAWAEGALLLFLFNLGHALEAYAMGRAKRAIEALAELAPETATILRDGLQVEVPVEEMKVGDTVLVRPNCSPSAPTDARRFLARQGEKSCEVFGQNNWRAVLLAAIAGHADLEGWVALA